MFEVLDPLAARYATWLGLPAHATVDTSDEDPGQVRAMPVILHANKAAPQAGHATMLLAALLHADGADELLKHWQADDFRCTVRKADRPQWTALHPGDDPLRAWRDHRVVAVRDAGFTEVEPGTVTVL